MNFFFSIKIPNFQSKLKIPTFQNEGHTRPDYNLYCLNIKNKNWNLELYSNKSINNFYTVDSSDSNNENIFFLGSNKEAQNYINNGLENLIKFNNFTSSSPAFRANLEISIDEGGFSSYQSEYPFEMANKKGSIQSSLSMLTNIDNAKNILIFKNIYKKPIQVKFKCYFVNLKYKKIIKEFFFVTNYTNFIEIENDLINEDIYFMSEDYLGIPIYLSFKNKHLSLEHTHPPHEYILSNDKFKKVAEYKKEFYEIISKKNF